MYGAVHSADDRAPRQWSVSELSVERELGVRLALLSVKMDSEMEMSKPLNLPAGTLSCLGGEGDEVRGTFNPNGVILAIGLVQAATACVEQMNAGGVGDHAGIWNVLELTVRNRHVGDSGGVRVALDEYGPIQKGAEG